MSLMYEVAAVNAAMIQAAEVCRQDMPEGDKLNAVLACFAGMKPVEAEPVMHSSWCNPWPYRTGAICRRCETHAKGKHKFCPECGAHMDAKGDATCG